ANIRRDVSLGQRTGDAKIDRGVHRLDAPLVLELGDFLLKQLAIHFVADGRNMAGLLSTQQTSGPANLKVAQGDLEAGPEHREALDGSKALHGDLGEDLVRR